MSGGKGGSTTSTVEIPEYLEGPIQENIQRAKDISDIGYVPQYGQQVATFTPMQRAAFAATNQQAQAFGVPSVVPQQQLNNAGYNIDPMTGTPIAAPGEIGVSSGPLFEQSLQRLEQERPGQKAAIDAFTIDPYQAPTGAGKGGGYGSKTYAAKDEAEAKANEAAKKAIAIFDRGYGQDRWEGP